MVADKILGVLIVLLGMAVGTQVIKGTVVSEPVAPMVLLVLLAVYGARKVWSRQGQSGTAAE